MVSFVISGLVGAVLSIIIGLIVLIFPKILNYAIGIYLILMGLLFFVAQFGL